MATNTTYDAVGRREDLSNIITSIAPEKTPMLTTMGKVSASNRYSEWQLDGLAASTANNAIVEGADVATTAGNQPERVGNYTQISVKAYQVSSTILDSDLAGRANEMNFQMVKGMKELKTDMEKNIMGNGASVAGSNSVARKSAGIEAWLETNTDRGVGGADGGFSAGIVAAPTDGAARAFTETQLKTVLASIATNGDDEPTMLSLGVTNKQVMSGFAGIADNRIDNQKAAKAVAVIGAVDIYAGDFGYLAVSCNKQQRDESALVLNPKLFKCATLSPVKTNDLSKTGVSEKKLLSTEYTLQCLNEKGSGIIADLTVA